MWKPLSKHNEERLGLVLALLAASEQLCEESGMDTATTIADRPPTSGRSSEVECRTRNAEVAGSIPAAQTNLTRTIL